MRFKV
jgi:hypothetical protein